MFKCLYTYYLTLSIMNWPNSCFSRYGDLRCCFKAPAFSWLPSTLFDFWSRIEFFNYTIGEFAGLWNSPFWNDSILDYLLNILGSTTLEPFSIKLLGGSLDSTVCLLLLPIYRILSLRNYLKFLLSNRGRDTCFYNYFRPFLQSEFLSASEYAYLLLILGSSSLCYSPSLLLVFKLWAYSPGTSFVTLFFLWIDFL
jgi:hypothetical protein